MAGLMGYRMRDCAGAERVWEVAKLIGFDSTKFPGAASKCEHGKTIDQTCRSCEGGYMQDTSAFADFRGEPAKDPETGEYLAGDVDAYDCIYLPKRYQAAINRAVKGAGK